MQGHPNHDTAPNIRFLAIKRLTEDASKVISNLPADQSSSYPSPSATPRRQSSSFVSVAMKEENVDIVGSDATLWLSDSFDRSEELETTNLKTIMKTKWFLKNIGECSAKDVSSNKEKSKSLKEGQKETQLPELSELQNLVEDLLWEDGLHEKDICVAVNKQRLQTDNDLMRQNEAIALTLVNYVVQEAEKKVNQDREKEETPAKKLGLLLKQKLNIKWPTIGEFNVKIGALRIREYVQSWSIDIRWGYCIDLLDIRENASSRYFIYDVQWCIPSNQKPVPDITVSVYFIYQVCKFLPADYPVTVSFVIEGNTTQHYVEDVPEFQEKWLTHVVKAKEDLMRKINF